MQCQIKTNYSFSVCFDLDRLKLRFLTCGMLYILCVMRVCGMCDSFITECGEFFVLFLLSLPQKNQKINQPLSQPANQASDQPAYQPTNQPGLSFRKKLNIHRSDVHLKKDKHTSFGCTPLEGHPAAAGIKVCGNCRVLLKPYIRTMYVYPFSEGEPSFSHI